MLVTGHSSSRPPGVENDVLRTLSTADRHMLQAVLARVVHTAEPSE